MAEIEDDIRKLVDGVNSNLSKSSLTKLPGPDLVVQPQRPSAVIASSTTAIAAGQMVGSLTEIEAELRSNIKAIEEAYERLRGATKSIGGADLRELPSMTDGATSHVETMSNLLSHFRELALGLHDGLGRVEKLIGGF